MSHLDYSAKGLKKEFSEANVIIGIGMGLTETEEESFPDFLSFNPMGLDLTEEIPEFLVYCAGINPVRLEGDSREKELLNIEKELKKGLVVGIKVYAGYYPYYVYDPVYEPIYELARKYNMPVVIHSGDTYSDRGLLKYSHPLNIDEVAVKYRDVNFVIAHFGDPWVMDTAELISKNPNVYADLSGLIVGDEREINRFKSIPLFVDHIKRGLVYADNYEKILFGSDWPLVPIKPYIEFVKSIIPEEFYENVFYKNALNVFPGLKRNLDF